MSRWIWRAAWLLLPAAWLSHRFLHQSTLTFFVSCASLVPLAKAMGDATEALAERMGPATGSLLNATFGNAAELILGISALRHGHVGLVKGSITGSILGNLLLVAGGSIVVGGARFNRLRFNRLAASSSVSTLFLAVVAIGKERIVGDIDIVRVGPGADDLAQDREAAKAGVEDEDGGRG